MCGECRDQRLLHLVASRAWTCLNPSSANMHHNSRNVTSLYLSLSSVAKVGVPTRASMSELDHEPQQASARLATKPQRTLACASCQQRKIKCDRRFPCSSCIKSNVHCVPVAVPRQRRRRFPEAELLQRVRHLEDLLRQHNIDFEPLHGSAAGKNGAEGTGITNDKEGGRTSPEIKTETTYEAKYVHPLSKLPKASSLIGLL